MRANLVDARLGRWPALLAVAGLTLGPAVAATSLVEVLESRGGAIVNGSIVRHHEFPLWAQVGLSATSGPVQVQMVIPLLVALAWFIGLGTALRVLADHSVGTAWRRVRPARLAEWFALGAILVMLALLGLHASVAVAGHLGGPLGVLTAALWTYGLARLALALPAMLVDGLRLPGALRHAVLARRGHAPTAALVLLTVVSPAVLLALLDPAVMPGARTWVGDVLWSAVVPLLEYLILVVTVPLQAVSLFHAYRAAYPTAPASSTDAHEALDGTESSRAGGREPGDVATDEHELTVTVHDLGGPRAAPYGSTAWPGTTPTWVADVMALDRPRRDARAEDEPRPLPRWLRIGAVALLSVGPAAVGPALLLINPHDLPVVTVARPEAGFSSRPLTMAVLNDGTVVSVHATQAALCRDAHCTDLDVLTMPCAGGAPPTPEGAATRNCPTEGPIAAADVAPDGTLLALVYDRDQDVRLFWCRLEPTDDGQCRWGGAMTLYQQPDQWWNRSMDVVALPGGGFAAVIVTPGPIETRATVRLITCERLDCPQPTVHSILTVPRLAEGGGLVDVSADPVSGTLVLGYLDRSDDSLFLGGCPAGCPDGPTVARIGRWPELAPNAAVPDQPALQVLATATGPAAVLGATSAREPAGPDDDAAQGPLEEVQPLSTIVVTCADPGCVTSQRSLQGFAMENVTLVANASGEAYIIGSLRGVALIGPLREGWMSGPPAVFGTIVAATLGPDNRLRLLLTDDQGPALVTLANPY